MELIVISAPWSVEAETQRLNQLFEAGLDCFHLRKPDWDAVQIRNLLKGLDPYFHQRIVIHQQHILADELKLKGVHYPEQQRLQMYDLTISDYKRRGLSVSTSIHDHLELPNLNGFDYVFYGPVFNSISKPGYKAIQNAELTVRSSALKVFALGGINTDNIYKVKQMHFDGAAVLGYLWMEPEKAVSRFKQLINELQNDIR